jgi:hypothetical protein
VQVSILQSNQAYGLYIQSGFFFNFFLCIGFDALVDVYPATGHRPYTGFFLYQEYFPVFKDGGTGIQFRCLETGFIAE